MAILTNRTANEGLRKICTLIYIGGALFVNFGQSEMERHRQIIYFKHYFLDFFDQQTEKVKEKIDRVLFIITVADRIPQKFFQHLEGTKGLYEIRIEFQGNIYRIFCCFDAGQVVVLFNGFQKKSQKTPPGELDKAVKIMEDYFNQKLKVKQNALARGITNINKKSKKS